MALRCVIDLEVRYLLRHNMPSYEWLGYGKVQDMEWTISDDCSECHMHSKG